MKTSPRTLLIPALAVCFLMALVRPAAAGGQPHMAAALDLLHQAHDGGDKIGLLRAAKRELEKAENNKADFRVEAIRVVRHAIVEGERGHQGKMEADISAAITLVHDGMAAAR